MNTAEELVIWEISESSRKGENVDSVKRKRSDVENRKSKIDFHQTGYEKNSGKYNMKNRDTRGIENNGRVL